MAAENKIVHGKLNVAGRQISMLSGEMHYWRIDPHQWRPALERIQEMGIELVASYICWDFHEVAPGELDFKGETDPRRNLVGFLELLREMKFNVLLRPGPYIYSEWRNNGVPDRVAAYQRLDPAFLKESEAYLREVIGVIKPFLATNHGNVIAVQADNEIDPWPAEYTEKLGIGKSRGVYTEYLQDNYANISEFNQLHHTAYRDLGEVRPVCEYIPDRPVDFSRYLDYLRFKHWFTDRVATWAVSTYRKLGVNVPMILNGYDGPGVQNWSHFGAIADLFGSDTYPSNEFTRWDDEFRFFLEKGRFSRAVSQLPYLAEFESGIWHGWHYDTLSLTPGHYRLAAMSAILGGFVGWNWYMLVNRDNWYMSPINEWGRTRPELFKTFKQIVEVYKQIDPPSLDHVCPIAVTGDTLQRAVVKTGEKFMKAMYATGIDFEIFNLEGDTACEKKLLFYSGRDWLGIKSQKNLANYVRNGGSLVFFGVVPTKDDWLRPTEQFSSAAAQGILPNLNQLEIRLGQCFVQTQLPWFEWFNEVDGAPIIARRMNPTDLTSEELKYQHELEVGQTYTIGHISSYGNGKIIYLGCDPNPELIRAVIQYAEITLPAQISASNWAGALYKKEEDFYLLIANPTGYAAQARVELDVNQLAGQGSYQAEEMLQKTAQILSPSEGRLTLFVDLAQKDATVFHIQRTNP